VRDAVALDDQRRAVEQDRRGAQIDAGTGRDPWRYARGMKTAVSVPDDVFERADRLARSTGRSRSDVYSAALREYVGRHAPDEVTAALNRVVDAMGDDAARESFVRESAQRTLEASEW